MFGKRLLGTKLLQRLAELEKIIEIEQEKNKTYAATLDNMARLVSIVKSGRTMRLTFLRDGKPYVIETMALISDDLPAHRAALLEPIDG